MGKLWNIEEISVITVLVMPLSTIFRLSGLSLEFKGKCGKSEMIKRIETERLTIIICDADLLKVAISGDEKLGKYLNVQVSKNWTEFGVGALKYTLEKLESDESEQGWWTCFPVHKKDNVLIGSGGYKGKPTENGEVEIGYEIAKEYRNQGLATEFAQALIDNAFTSGLVKVIWAHTLGETNPSTEVLKKCGFVRIEEINDPDEGLIWKWELKK